MTPTADKNTYTVLTSCFPVYALTEAIVRGVPGLSLSMLTIPRKEGYSSYELSDWEISLLSVADVYVCFGRGFEGFDSADLNDRCIVISLLNDEELISTEELMTFTSDNETLPLECYDVYLSESGTKRLLQKLSVAFSGSDPDYATVYENNLLSATQKLECIEYDTSIQPDTIAINPAFAYMVEDIYSDAQRALYLTDNAMAPEGIIDLRGRMNNMLNMDASFSYDDYVESLRLNYTVLTEGLK
ncbi:MAG: zinc ABC transporter substrate-binding protein [Clostridiales bacterium]|nr:zinc ABC transporter substrate-binding protein [Clostridiales bacterium]